MRLIFRLKEKIMNRFEILTGGSMEINIRDLILRVLENEGYICELTKEGIIFVEDEDVDKTVAIHLQVTN